MRYLTHLLVFYDPANVPKTIALPESFSSFCSMFFSIANRRWIVLIWSSKVGQYSELVMKTSICAGFSYDLLTLELHGIADSVVFIRTQQKWRFSLQLSLLYTNFHSGLLVVVDPL